MNIITVQLSKVWSPDVLPVVLNTHVVQVVLDDIKLNLKIDC